MSINSPLGSNYALCEKPFAEEIDKFLYDQLKKAPHFRYAFFGREAYDTFFDISGSLPLEDSNFPWKGLVINFEVWEEMGKPNLYEPFCDGYLWIPKIFGDLQ